MTVVANPLPGVLVLEPRSFADARGFFLEAFQEARYRELGIPDRFVQDNQSRSSRGVLRGLHFQVRQPQAKLVTVIRGRVFDVGVDVRRGSPTFGQWFGAELSDTGPRQMYLAPGFAHGFVVLSEWADVHYKVSRYYDPGDEAGILWNDPSLGIEWPVDAAPHIHPRDAAYPRLRDLPHDQLPFLGVVGGD